MSYPLLRTGNQLPAVAVAQQLLRLNGAEVPLNGFFGLSTGAAVRTFQEENRIYPVNGIINRETWTRLTTSGHLRLRLPVLDCIDVWDMALNEMGNNDNQAAGGSPGLVGGRSRNVAQAVDEILSVAGTQVFLLRFHRQGGDGFAGRGAGYGEYATGVRSGVESNNPETLAPVLERLRPVFGPYGCIQFMHCVADAETTGHRFLERVADVMGVPATAAKTDQPGSGDATIAYEGATYTAVPDGRTVQSWAAGLPSFPGAYRVGPPVIAKPHTMIR